VANVASALVNAATRQRCLNNAEDTVMLIRAFATFVWLVTVLCSARAEVTNLRFGQIPSTIHGVTSLPRFIAERKGFFAREGLKVELVQIPGGTDKMVKALDRGDVDLTQTATPYLVQAVLAGSDAVAVAGETANPIYSLIAKPEITTFADLKGKLVGLSLPVDTISISMRKLMAVKGLTEADYRVKELVGTPVRFDCLKKGECDAVPLGQPDDLIAIKQGYHRLGVSNEAVGSFQFEVVAARRSWAQTHKDEVVRFVRALAAAFRFVRDLNNRDEVAKLIVELTGSTDDIARDTLKLYFEPDRGVLPKQAEISLAGLAQVIAFMTESHVIASPPPPPDRFIDLQYLEAAGVK
jgi:ABC-type nitrate/sulfonate/bicarbonate transport system substrate-binding protein